MKLDPDLVIEEMLHQILSQDPAVTPVGRDGSAAEIAEATASFRAAMADDMQKVKTLCIGCGGEVALRQSAPCVCGGFVCPACRKIEVEGECHHERPSWLPADDE